MYRMIFFGVCLILSSVVKGQYEDNGGEGYKLVWADEFTKNGKPDSTNWSYENGFVRNEEDEWYQSQNAYCKDGYLFLEARKESKANPTYINGSKDWSTSRKNIEYTSASIISMNKQQWLYGRFEMRGKIDVSKGLSPAWWMLGVENTWPLNGEIDMMEYYGDSLLANIAIGAAAPGDSYWFSKVKHVNAAWASKFHVWRMDWDSSAIAMYVDDSLINKTPLDSLVNKDGSGYNPFKHPQYMVLNLAIGGPYAGDPSPTKFPRRFEVDYVRVYQKKNATLNK